MKHTLLIAILALTLVARASAQSTDQGLDDPSKPARWFATFSIIAFDPATGDLGVGVQSHAFTAGAAVPYAIPGVGAVATQAAANRLYGPKAIELLKQGLSPADVVKRLTDEDPGRDTRQLAVIDARGRSAVYTGKHVIDRNADVGDVDSSRRLRRPHHRQEFFGAGQHAGERRRAAEHGASLRARQGHDGRAPDGRARRGAGGRRRYPRHAVGRTPRRPAGSAGLERRRRSHRRSAGGRCGGSVQGAAAAAQHQPRHAAEAHRPVRRARGGRQVRRGDRGASGKRWRFSRTATRCTTRWRSATRRPGVRCRRWSPLREAIRLHPNLARQAAADPLFAPMRELAEFKRLIQVGGPAASRGGQQ